MTDQEQTKDLGFVVTKPPLESGLVANILTIAQSALDQGRSVGIFLISDGVWLVKKDQKNHVAGMFERVLGSGAEVIASSEHLEAAGISEDEIIDGVTVTKRVYKDLVTNVMENWDKVMSMISSFLSDS